MNTAQKIFNRKKDEATLMEEEAILRDKVAIEMLKIWVPIMGGKWTMEEVCSDAYVFADIFIESRSKN